MDDYLSKPFRRDELAAVVRRWIVRQDPPLETNGNDLLDATVLGQLRELEARSGRPLVVDLFCTYLVSADEAMRSLETAVSAADVEVVVSVAHRLIGSSGAVGALYVAEAFTALERAAISGDLSACRSVLADVAAALSEARPALEAEMSRVT